MRNALLEIDVALALLRSTIADELIANLNETQEQLEADISMLVDEVNKET